MEPKLQINCIAQSWFNGALYMNKSQTSRLQFFIKITDIIGRAFSEIQQLLTTQLKRQQQQYQIANPTINNNTDNITDRAQQLNGKINDVNNQILSKSITQIQQNKKYSDNNYNNDNNGNIDETINKQKNYSEIDERKELQESSKQKSIHKTKNKNMKAKKSQEENQIKVKNKKKKINKKKKNNDGRPHPPLNAFMLFLKQNKQDLMKQKPELNPSQVSTFASTIWNNFNDAQKDSYIQKYRKNHQIYLEQIKNFQLMKKNRVASAQNTLQKNAIQNEEPQQKKLKKKKKQDLQDSSFQQNEKTVKDPLKIQLRSSLKLRRFRRRRNFDQVICIQSQEQSKPFENDS